jgi:hypothetical protein
MLLVIIITFFISVNCQFTLSYQNMLQFCDNMYNINDGYMLCKLNDIDTDSTYFYCMMLNDGHTYLCSYTDKSKINEDQMVPVILDSKNVL